MKANRSFHFTHTISRLPGNSVTHGLRAAGNDNPDPLIFASQHASYIDALKTAGAETLVLPQLEEFPDSVFVEDAALCFDGIAVVLRPGAESRFGEAAAIDPELRQIFSQVVTLESAGSIDGGDILLTDTEALIGLSERTDAAGVEALRPTLQQHGYDVRIVNTPPGVLHFKSDCALLDSETIFSTRALAASGCFDSYQVIEAPDGEEAAANLIRVNDYVILRSGFPATRSLLEQNGYRILTVDSGQAAIIDGGLSCMSLRFSLPD